MSKHRAEKPTTGELAAPDAPAVAPETASQPASAAAEPLPMTVPSTPPTAEEIQELKTQAERAQQWYDRLLRTTADFDNYRKRAARERQDAVRLANEGLLQKLVPVLDNFDMAMTAAGSANASVEGLRAGVAMIHQQLKTALAEAGLEEIDASGKPFDPNLHEAVAQEETTEAAEGCVLRQLRKGYRLRERLLRPANVVVAKAPSTHQP